MFENDFERLSYYYKNKWAREPQLRQYVGFGVITPEEFKLITGEDF